MSGAGTPEGVVRPLIVASCVVIALACTTLADEAPPVASEGVPQPATTEPPQGLTLAQFPGDEEGIAGEQAAPAQPAPEAAPGGYGGLRMPAERSAPPRTNLRSDRVARPARPPMQAGLPRPRAVRALRAQPRCRRTPCPRRLSVGAAAARLEISRSRRDGRRRERPPRGFDGPADFHAVPSPKPSRYAGLSVSAARGASVCTSDRADGASRRGAAAPLWTCARADRSGSMNGDKW
jgi:hypothetical protein